MPASPSDIFSLQSLCECTLACTRNSRWKETTQRYLHNMLLNNLALSDDLLSGTYRVSPTVNFRINERGKVRDIEAPIVRDRTVHKALVKHVLAPRLTNCLIYDNYASLPGRGTSFARKRFEIMLRRFYNQYGTDGYVLLIDIRKYFPSIDHDILKQLIAPRLADEDPLIRQLIDYIIDTSNPSSTPAPTSRVPVSCADGLSSATVPEASASGLPIHQIGPYYSTTGLNLGAEPPQLFAIYYLNPLDQYIKTVRSVKYYGRYMDDIFILAHTRQELQSLLADIERILTSLHLQLNRRKTHITPISRPFTFLQIKYTLLPSGRIVKQPSHSKIVRERRRLKAHRRLLRRGRMTIFDVINCYRSWRGSLIRDHNAYHHTLRSLDSLFCSLFPGIDIYNLPRPPKPDLDEVLADTFALADTSDWQRCLGLNDPRYPPTNINPNPFIQL